jgi:hypothetical protein
MSHWIDIEQNTEEWFNLRAGKITGSAIKDIMANYPKSWGNPGKNRARKVATERMKGGPLQEVHYSNKHMGRGHEQEPDALFLYYDQTGRMPTNGGFYDLGSLGVSPDGRVTKEGGVVEVKSVIASTHFERIEKGGPDRKYKWQYTLELKAAHEVDGFEWLDFISYCADFPPGKQLHISRIKASDKEVQEDFKKIDERLEKFEQEVQRLIELV